MIRRADAWSILVEFTRSDSLRKHARAVEASMRAYALRYGEDPDVWGIAGMLHDFDYEMHPRAPQHPTKGAEILIARGVPEPIVHAILAHADYAGVPRVSVLDRALYACDELSGFVHAVALVRPFDEAGDVGDDEGLVGERARRRPRRAHRVRRRRAQRGRARARPRARVTGPAVGRARR